MSDLSYCNYCGTGAMPADEPNCSSLAQAYEQTPTRPYGCPWFDKDSRKAHPRPSDPAPCAREPVAANGRVHHLKTWPQYFNEVLSSRKLFEWRVNDRDYEAGDTLILQEWEPVRENLNNKEGRYTGREISKLVTYVFSPFPVQQRTVVMSLTDAAPVQQSAATTVCPSDQVVKDATTEFLSHRGERPYRVLRGGMELWETYTAAIRAALKAAVPNRQCNCCKGMPDSVGCDCPHSRPTATSAEPVADQIDDMVAAWLDPLDDHDEDERPRKFEEAFRADCKRLVEAATPPSSGNADAGRKAATLADELENLTMESRKIFDDVICRAISFLRSAALSSAPVAGEWPTREQIARSIDPRAFDGWQGLYDANLEKEGADFSKRCADAWYGEKKEAALKTADAVLAYFVPRNERQTGGPHS